MGGMMGGANACMLRALTVDVDGNSTPLAQRIMFVDNLSTWWRRGYPV